MEGTVYISSIIMNTLLGCFAFATFCVALTGIQNMINEHKRNKRDEEYHAKRMKETDRF